MNNTSNINKIKLFLRLFKVAHFGMSLLLFFIAWISFYTYNGSIWFDHRYSFYLLAAYAVALLFFSRIYNSYEVEYERISALVYSQTLGVLISICGIYALVSVAWHHLYNVMPFVLMLVIQFTLNCLWSKLVHDWFYRNTPKYQTALIYRNERDRRRIYEVETFYKRFNVTKKLENPQDIQQIKETIYDCEAVLIAGIDASLRNGIIKQCVEDNIQCFFAPHIGDIIVASSQYEQAFSSPIMSVRQGNTNLEYEFLKRTFDIVFSLVFIVLLSPLMLIVALAIIVQDGHTPIYKQVRLTKNGREFNIYKFRSMRIDAEADGKARLASNNDDRITSVGRIIRACRLDELPQLFNILKGDMSIVGPRPERPEIAEQYERELPAFKMRLKVKAGLTGYAQIYGKYNTEPYEKLEMDLLYIANMSLLTDIMLVFGTIKILFLKESTEGIHE